MGVPDRTVRRVRTRTGRAAVAGAEGEETTQEPSPAEKLTKYFPEAALAFYIGLDPMLRQVADGDALRTLLWGALVLAAVLCWFYLARFWISTPRQRWLSIAALVVYVAAIGGPFGTIEGYKTIYGAIVAFVITGFLVLVPAEDLPEPPAT